MTLPVDVPTKMSASEETMPRTDATVRSVNSLCGSPCLAMRCCVSKFHSTRPVVCPTTITRREPLGPAIVQAWLQYQRTHRKKTDAHVRCYQQLLTSYSNNDSSNNNNNNKGMRGMHNQPWSVG